MGLRAQYILKFLLPGDVGRLKACALWITHIFIRWGLACSLSLLLGVKSSPVLIESIIHY